MKAKKKVTKAPARNKLTARERKRIKELRSILSGKGRKRKAPLTAQKSITFEHMYQDGVCRVTGSYYTKMVEFYDINYELLDTPGQADILQAYSELLNYFEPGIKFQLFLFNRKVSEETLVSQINIPLQDDGFDYIREEFSHMLKNQMARGEQWHNKIKIYGFRD